MRAFTLSAGLIVSLVFFGGCATQYILSPDNLASQLKADQKSEAPELATTTPGQLPNKDVAGSARRLLCTNQSGQAIWVYTNENTELHITKRTGEMVSMYFDTVVLEDNRLKGVTSRIRKTEGAVDLSDILKIEVYTVNSKTEPANPH